METPKQLNESSSSITSLRSLSEGQKILQDLVKAQHEVISGLKESVQELEDKLNDIIG